MTCHLLSATAGCILACVSVSAAAQISLTTAVDLAYKNSPRVRMAQDDSARALAALQQTHDVYVPSLVAGAGLGEAYGYSPNPPTLFTANAQSLVFNYAQFAYIRSARSGLAAANLALDDAQAAAAEDTALTFVALNHDQQRRQVLGQQMQYVNELLGIVQQRFDAGVETQLELTSTKLTQAQFRLAIMRSDDDIANDRDHLARLVGVPPESLHIESGFPVPPPADDLETGTRDELPPGIASAFANAKARQQAAVGDSRYLFRPQLSLIVQYSQYASFTESFKNLQTFFRNPVTQKTIGTSEQIYGVQITVPLFDRLHRDKSRQSFAESAHALHEAQSNEAQALDGQHRLRHSIAELQAREQVAELEQQVSEQQLEIRLIQVNTPIGDGPQLTPKDERTSRIGEREKYLAVIDARRQTLDAEINLMRQTGRLVAWLKTVQIEPQIQSAPNSGQVSPSSTPPPLAPQP